MSRYARRREPNVRRKQRIELENINVPLRAVLVGIAILIAALAFGSVVNQWLTVKTGWQEIEAANPKTTAHQSFSFSYCLGAGEQSARAELRAVTALYTETLDDAFRALSGEETEGVSNLYTLNRHPNEDVQVHPLLYAAFETLEATGSRYAYLAPMMEQYTALFACTYDEEAALYDPVRNADAREYIDQAAAFAADPNAVRVKLLPDSTLRLEVSDDYLKFARENEIEAFVDFGILRNAFLCDAAADALLAQGYERGVVSSLDGFTRNLSSEEFSLNLFDLADGKVTNPGAVGYTAPAALAALRAFPTSASDQLNYYVYSDGTVVVPYLNAYGLAHAEVSFLACLSAGESAANLAIRALDAYTGGDRTFAALDDLSWVSVDRGEVTLHGTQLHMVQ